MTSEVKTTEINELFSKLDSLKAVDLSPLIERGIPRYPTHPHLVIDQTVVHEHDGYYCQTISMAEHTASHVDSPAHIHPDMMDITIETFPVNYLIRPAVVYDLSIFNPQPGDLITLDQILSLEEKMKDKVQEGEIALLHYGWMKYWSVKEDWKWYASNAPGLHQDVAKLFKDRGIRAVGSDTIACDQAMVDGVSKKSYGHDEYWLPNNILIMESLTNLDQISTRSLFIASPLKIHKGSGSPIRAMAYCTK
ncbi:cyclase family protein [Domibacillus robiginosus]|uniref:cyclase family protein n=1 Tax=Domibacillus robiginosus TaxID=1071054 RepID=UPI00067BC4B3|nr:cyclase family protein [Domibacillus robiginosus]